MKIKIIFINTLVILAITLFLLAAIEGFSSFALSYTNFTKVRIAAERLHTEYDSLLGWINKKNVFIKDMYGPKKNLKINGQRFRNKNNFDIKIPTGKKRWICSGDSFTFGYGVDNDNAWCSLLSSLKPGVETINMGQGGYGIDQAYLWYMRDGIKFQHDLVIFAFITEDIRRMAADNFANYPKPLLKIESGKITVQNTPLPKPGLLVGYLPRYKPLLEKLSVFQLTNMLTKKTNIASDTKNTAAPQNNSDLLDLSISIFDELYKFNNEHDRQVLIVHLPTEIDYKKSQSLDSLKNLFTLYAKKKGWTYIDLISDFQQLRPQSVPELFIQKGMTNFSGALGHYSEKGNQYIAHRILEKIPGN